MMKHTCKPMEEIFKRSDSYVMMGHAFRDIEKYDGKEWWLMDDDNGTVIHFCPFCGVRLESLEGTSAKPS